MLVTGKQAIWFLLFPDRENTGNFVVTQERFLRHRENIFDYIHYCKKHVSLDIFSKKNLPHFAVYTLSKLIQAVLETN